MWNGETNKKIIFFFPINIREQKFIYGMPLNILSVFFFLFLCLSSKRGDKLRKIFTLTFIFLFFWFFFHFFFSFPFISFRSVNQLKNVSCVSSLQMVWWWWREAMISLFFVLLFVALLYIYIWNLLQSSMPSQPNTERWLWCFFFLFFWNK